MAEAGAGVGWFHVRGDFISLLVRRSDNRHPRGNGFDDLGLVAVKSTYAKIVWAAAVEWLFRRVQRGMSKRDLQLTHALLSTLPSLFGLMGILSGIAHFIVFGPGSANDHFNAHGMPLIAKLMDHCGRQVHTRKVQFIVGKRQRMGKGRSDGQENEQGQKT